MCVVGSEQWTRPWWYYLGFGLLMGAGVVSFLLAIGIGRGLTVLGLVVVGGLFDRVASRWGSDPPWSIRPSHLLFFAAAIVLMAAILWGASVLIRQGLPWVAWVAGVAAFALVTGSGLLWERLRSRQRPAGHTRAGESR